MFTARFERTGRPEDLAEGLRRVRAAVDATTDDMPDRPTLLNNMAVILRYRAWNGGDPAELDEAITHLEHAETLPMANVPQVRLTLGLALLDRFARTGDLGLLDRSLRLHRLALNELRPGSPLTAPLHQAIGIGLFTRLLRNFHLPDLDAAIDSFRAAVDATPLHRPARAMLLDTLGNAVRLRGELTGSADDIRDAGELSQDAVDLLPEGGYGSKIVLANIAQVLRAMYQRTGDPIWLDRAVATLQLVCDRQLTTGLMYPDMHLGLANLLVLRHDLRTAAENQHGATDDQHRAVDAYRKAVSSTAAGHTHAVLAAGRAWIGWAVRRSAWAEVAEAGEHVLEAAHRLMRAQLSRSNKEDWLRDLQSLPTEIAIARAYQGDSRGATVAIEEGCAILLSEALQRQLREFDQLSALGHAPLAERYRDAAAKLVRLTVSIQPRSADVDSQGRDMLIHAVAGSLDAVTEEIRAVPGYESFLRRPTFASIEDAAWHNQLLYLAAGRTEGLALLVRAGDVVAHRLPGLVAESVRTRCDQLRAAQGEADLRAIVDEISEWLWATAVASLVPYIEGCVTMIPVGHLSALPIHASRGANGVGLLDTAVVRYSPNALAVVEAVRKAARTGPDRLVAIAEPAPVDAPALPGARAEAAVAAATFDAQVLAGPDADRAAVLAVLGTARVIHFACHGCAEPNQPSRSGVQLAGNEMLTVADLAEQGFDARLVVLSACQTAVAGALLPEEVIGLPTAMLQAGAAGVIGSLWPVLDNRALLLMVSFYEQWRQHRHEPADALRAAQHWMRTTSDGEKFEKFDRLLGGATWLPEQTVRACWDALALTEPDGRFYASPAGWAAFCYVRW